ncbi:hypothetical protein OWR29_15675 [Actinoplanes sp. Pm04-4]|uniref:Uncharacterized protein n=1 Tax=Paractinoplanes pyxinae TaxID=2997416 RepID=A0ABT4B1E1_9ACTN|nr:hypothetical protein [Actinoplanes pyxinae]MCY1139438.1 hypothetical protein [Actinoplanes pyxinae]
MSNSRVARIHTTDDPQAALRLARQLVAWSDDRCSCSRHVQVDVETTTHELGRYLDLGAGVVAVDRPAGRLPEVVSHLFPDGNHSAFLDLVPQVVTTLRQLPDLAVRVSTTDRPVDSGVEDIAVAAAGEDPVSISWMICWPMDHSLAGFELGLNGADTWFEENRPGHSIFVHSSWAEVLPQVADAVGCRVLGEPGWGW